METITIAFIVCCVIGLIALAILWHAPRSLIMKSDAKGLYEIYKSNQPPRKLLSQWGLMAENIFYLSAAISFVLLLLV